jgi:hypothetical protein
MTPPAASPTTEQTPHQPPQPTRLWDTHHRSDQFTLAHNIWHTRDCPHTHIRTPREAAPSAAQLTRHLNTGARTELLTAHGHTFDSCVTRTIDYTAISAYAHTLAALDATTIANDITSRCTHLRDVLAHLATWVAHSSNTNLPDIITNTAALHQTVDRTNILIAGARTDAHTWWTDNHLRTPAPSDTPTLVRGITSAFSNTFHPPYQYPQHQRDTVTIGTCSGITIGGRHLHIGHVATLTQAAELVHVEGTRPATSWAIAHPAQLARYTTTELHPVTQLALRLGTDLTHAAWADIVDTAAALTTLA